jgi:hypothetical protein
MLERNHGKGFTNIQKKIAADIILEMSRLGGELLAMASYQAMNAF